MKKLITTMLVCLSVAGVVAAPSFAGKPTEKGDLHAASVNNTNANSNACWGQDRSFYASGGARDIPQLDWDNLDIKQSFPTELGSVGEQRADWVATYCAAP
jgi:hypothetical protein